MISNHDSSLLSFSFSHYPLESSLWTFINPWFDSFLHSYLFHKSHVEMERHCKEDNELERIEQQIVCPVYETTEWKKLEHGVCIFTPWISTGYKVFSSSNLPHFLLKNKSTHSIDLLPGNGELGGRGGGGGNLNWTAATSGLKWLGRFLDGSNGAGWMDEEARDNIFNRIEVCWVDEFTRFTQE